MTRIATTILTTIAVEEEKMEKVMLKSLKSTWKLRKRCKEEQPRDYSRCATSDRPHPSQSHLSWFVLPTSSFAWESRNAMSKMKFIMPAKQKRGNFKTLDCGDSYII
jgi:hypothetical protein